MRVTGRKGLLYPNRDLRVARYYLCEQKKVAREKVYDVDTESGWHNADKLCMFVFRYGQFAPAGETISPTILTDFWSSGHDATACWTLISNLLSQMP